jgi:hypothetical protein
VLCSRPLLCIVKSKSKSSHGNGEESNNMQQEHPVETILHSKFESNGHQKYFIRWMGDYKHSWQPKDNIASDVIEDFKRKIQERANEHLSEVSVDPFQCLFLTIFVLPSICPPHWIHFFLCIRIPRTRLSRPSCILIRNQGRPGCTRCGG